MKLHPPEPILNRSQASSDDSPLFVVDDLESLKATIRRIESMDEFRARAVQRRLRMELDKVHAELDSAVFVASWLADAFPRYNEDEDGLIL